MNAENQQRLVTFDRRVEEIEGPLPSFVHEIRRLMARIMELNAVLLVEGEGIWVRVPGYSEVPGDIRSGLQKHSATLRSLITETTGNGNRSFASSDPADWIEFKKSIDTWVIAGLCPVSLHTQRGDVVHVWFFEAVGNGVIGHRDDGPTLFWSPEKGLHCWGDSLET